MLFCFREHGWSIRLQYSREFVHFTHNSWSSPFTDKTMARLSLSSPSIFWIQPCQEPPNVGTQVRFPTKYKAKTYPICIVVALEASEFWNMADFFDSWTAVLHQNLTRWPDNHSAQKKTWFYFEVDLRRKRSPKRAFILRKFLVFWTPNDTLYI